LGRRKRQQVNWTNIVSTLSTFVLALTALITVYITLTALAEEREARRPYLTMQESPQVTMKDNLNLEFKFYNVGVHPAEELSSRSLVFNESMETTPIHNETFEVVNEIPRDSSSSLLISIETSTINPNEQNIKPYYIVISLQYDDPILKKVFQQTVFFKWNGVTEGRIQPIIHVQTDEKTQILNYLHQQQLELESTK